MRRATQPASPPRPSVELTRQVDRVAPRHQRAVERDGAGLAAAVEQLGQHAVRIAGVVEQRRRHAAPSRRTGAAGRRSRSPRRAGPSRVSASPSPPLASGTSDAEHAHLGQRRPTPWPTWSASARAPSPLRAPCASVPSGHAARTTSGGHSLARRSRTASRKASWSSVKANRIGATSSGGRGRARRRCCAGSRWCRRRSGRTGRTASPCVHGPSSSASGPSRSRAISCSSTSSSDHQSFTRLVSAPAGRPSARAGDGLQRLQPVGLGLHPALRRRGPAAPGRRRRRAGRSTGRGRRGGRRWP